MPCLRITSVGRREVDLVSRATDTSCINVNRNIKVVKICVHTVF